MRTESKAGGARQLLELFTPYAVLCGLVSLTMCVMQGATWLTIKTEGAVQARSRAYGRVAALVLVGLFAVAGVYTGFIDGYVYVDGDIAGPSNPLHKVVEMRQGGWYANYETYPWMLAAPLLGFAGALGAFMMLTARREILSWVASSISLFGIVSTAGVSMFPFLMPSSVDPVSSLTVWDSSSSHLTLFIMTICAVIFVPIILAYTSWVYKILAGKVTEAQITEKSSEVY